MSELYIEGLASHGGPSHASAAREGGGEALTAVRVGPAIEPRNQGSGVQLDGVTGELRLGPH